MTAARLFPGLLLLLLLAGLLRTQAQTATRVGWGWAKNNVNGAVFRKNSVVSEGQNQYVAYYDSAGYVTLAKRRLPAGPWQVQRTSYQGNVKDAHNVISLMVDGAGYLHLSFDHHNNPLRYCRSVAPGSLALGPLEAMTGDHEQKVSYPEFYRFPGGDLLFLYRDGGSGNGNLVLNRYALKTRRWTRLHDVLLDGENQRNAYWQACLDQRGTLHLAWVWRESPDVASNHDLAYACSKDGGRTWQKSTGEAYQLPIRAATAEYAARIPQNSELINQTSITADAAGRPYVASYWRPAGSQVPQYQVVYLSNRQWRTVPASQRTTPFSLSGAGTKKIPISRPQLLLATRQGKTTGYLLCRDAERQDRVSVLTCPDLPGGAPWTAADLTSSPVGNWEPSYDTERWKNEQTLSLFVQRTGQGDGETLENLPPQPVTILDWHPGGAAPVRPVALAGGAGPAATPATPGAAPPGYQLVWADEFNQPGRPDSASWGYERGFVRNHEAQWYQPENARCENGQLIIEARVSHQPNPTYQPGSADWRTSRPALGYTSASLNTRGRHQWQYGRFELRARIPTGPGLWPAFWTLGVTQPWPSNGEIDIMEYYRGKLLANVASGTAQPHTAKWHSETKALSTFADLQWASRFHIWRMDWTAEAIRLYVDDELLNETPLRETLNQDGTNFNPMQQPHYLLLNLALGGDNGGEMQATALPARYEIDYVRVYQPAP